MQIGMMNNPQYKLLEEVAFAAENSFDFLDLTLEPPQGIPSPETIPRLRDILADHGMSCIGHTAYYLPIDSPFQQLRQASADIIKTHLDLFHAVGSRRVTLHAAFSYPHRFFPYSSKLEFWTEALTEILPAAHARGIVIMLENVPETRDHLRLLKDLFRRFPDLAFHLDVGHANLNVTANSTFNYLRRFKKRLIHIHLSDNFGRSQDLHLPIGAGGIPWNHVLKVIKNAGYDGTFTIEVFSQNRSYLVKSREILRMLWEQLD
ncbi:MAG TPA: sugar phosphate isomerase/epimerase family protein [bacterium]|nr:sugar phosphate isomerase/epimerase family protein [bacterium]